MSFPGSHIAKATGAFFVLLGGVELLSNFSRWFDDAKRHIYAKDGAIFVLWGAWVAAFMIPGVVSMKLKHDLDMLRAQKKREQKRKRR